MLLPWDKPDAERVFDLSQWDIHMTVRGNFERKQDRLLTVDADKGRMIYGDTSGNIYFLFQNSYGAEDGEVTPLVLRNATEISQQEVQRFDNMCR